MILFELTNSEDHPVYQALEISNGNRQYSFIHSAFIAAFDINRLHLSQTVIKALNYQVIACLHTNAGDYRPCQVQVGTHTPPAHYRVGALMEDFVDTVNRIWEIEEPIALASFVLWRLNHIHPFINGNGRTARAASYFVLCLKVGGWLPGKTILPELLRRERVAYIAALQAADLSLVTGNLNLTELHALITKLLEEQINGAGTAPPTSPGPAPESTPLLPAP